MGAVELLSADFLKFMVPLSGGAVAWFINERRKRSWDEYQRKEQSYRELLRTFRGFYVETSDASLRAEFLHQVNVCWLYCPDDVIKAAYAFLETVHTDAGPKAQGKLIAAGQFIASIRCDLLSRRPVRTTRLSGSDFQHLGVRP